MRRALACALLLLELTACGNSGPPVSQQLSTSDFDCAPPDCVYGHTFDEGSGGWQTAIGIPSLLQAPADALACWSEGVANYCYVPVPTQNGAMRLTSPWYHDPNHAPPGAGYLSLLTWVYLNGYAGADTAHLPELDLRDLLLVVQMRAKNLDVKAGGLYFWFQTLMPDGKYVNYAYTGEALNSYLSRDDSFSQIRLPMRADPSLWTCLGASQARAQTYGCVPLEEAMAKVNGDFGFIILPVDPSPMLELQPSGKIFIRSIELRANANT